MDLRSLWNFLNNQKRILRRIKMKKQAYPKGKSEIERIVTAFLKGETSKRLGNYFIEGNALVYKTTAATRYERPWDQDQPAERLKHRNIIKRLKDAAAKGIVKILHCEYTELNEESRKVEYEALAVEQIALRLGTGDIIGNSSRLKHLPLNSFRGTTDIQDLLGQYIPMIPFNVFTEAKLNTDTFTVVDRGAEETIKVKRTKTVKKNKVPTKVEYFENQHFTGTSLFSVGDKIYLFDMDRRELEHGIVNPFVVEIPNSKEVKTISDAYDALMPVEVKEAFKHKMNVKRQGEWFFIPVSADKAALLEIQKKHTKNITLQAGPNRPNHATGVQLYKGKPIQDQRGLRDFEYIEEARTIVKGSEFYVTGKVTHSGREHADLTLRGWFKAVPNTATNSFTISGDID
jgi:hypothetical protein